MALSIGLTGAFFFLCLTDTNLICVEKMSASRRAFGLLRILLENYYLPGQLQALQRINSMAISRSCLN